MPLPQLNNLLASGQNQVQFDPVGNYMAGDQMRRKNANQDLRNNLLQSQTDMRQQQSDRQQQIFDRQNQQYDQGQEMFATLMSEFNVEGPKDEQIKSTLLAQAGSGDIQGAIKNAFKVMNTELQTTGQTILAKQVNDNGDLTLVFGDASGQVTGQHTIPGIGKKTQPKQQDSFSFSSTEDGTSFGYNQALNAGAGPQVKLSPDYAPVNPEDVGAGVRPIEGSKAWREQEAAKAADVTRRKMINQGVSELNESIADARELADPNDFAKSPIGSTIGTTGFIGGLLSGIKGTDSYALGKVTESIQANLGFDKLQSMRDMSPTGGALGQVSERELGFLISAVAALDPGMGEQRFMQALSKVERHYENWAKTVNGVNPFGDNNLKSEKPARRYTYEAGKGMTEVK